MFKNYEKVCKYNGYIIAKKGELYAIFTSELVNAIQPLYDYFTSKKGKIFKNHFVKNTIYCGSLYVIFTYIVFLDIY